jgi:hypothetical protein
MAKHDFSVRRCSQVQAADFHIRGFRDGDEDEIIQLFEKCYGDYAGYVSRTREYWRWCCLERPDVERTGVLIAAKQADDKLLGYAVVGTSGSIWELGYDGEESGKEVVGLLLEAAIQYLTSVGASSVNVQAPVDDDVVREACAGLGLVEARPPRAFVSILDFQELLSLLASDGKEKLEGVNETIEIVAKDAPKWINGRAMVRICDGAISGVDDEGQKPTISLDCFGR